MPAVMKSATPGGDVEMGYPAQATPPPTYAPPPPTYAPPPFGYAPQGGPPPEALPYPHYAVQPALVPPQPGQVILRYAIERPQTGCCKCDGMTPAGVLAVVLLLLFFWPLAFLPCLMEDCFESFQRPVWGYPPGAGGQ